MKNITNQPTTLLSRWTHRPFVLQGFFGMLLLIVLMIPSVALSQWSSDPTINNLVSNATNDQVNPASISDGNGGAIIAWADNRNGNYDIYAQRVNASGTVQWGANAVAICTMDSDQVNPSIVTDGNGGAIIAWEDKRSGTYDIYAQRVNSSGVPQWIPSTGDPLVVVVFDQVNMAMASDGNGGALLTWEDYRANTGPGLADIYTQKVDANGVTQWVANGIGVCTNAAAQFGPRIISDGAGGAILTWSDARAGDYDIYSQRVTAAAGLTGTAGGVAVCTFASDQTNPDICSDGAGGAIIVWQDRRSTTDIDIWAQRIGPSLAIVWGVDGVVMNNNAAFDQVHPKIVSDGAGGALMAWEDYRTGLNADIYAQRVAAAGTVATGWNPNGVAVCVAQGNQTNPQVTSDSSGGEIITWTDTRDSTTNGGVPDIYASRITSGFALPWIANGAPIGTADSTQSYPAIVSDGSGGAIIAWQDKRFGNYDIYASRINPGVTPPVVYTITATFGANGNLSPSGSVSVNENSSQQFTYSANGGYHVDSVLVDGIKVDSTTSYTFTNVTSNHSIRLVFAINAYTITASAGANGTISPSGSVSVNYNASQSFTIAPNTGYHIASVVVDEINMGAVSNYTFDTVKTNHSITASFAINTYTLTITSPNGSVTKNPDLAQYDSNSTVQLTPVPNSGYHFVNWSGSASGSANPLSVTMYGNRSITANFAINTYALIITSPNGSVTKNPDLAQYDSNSIVQLTPVPNSGYHFVDWSGDASGSTVPLSVTMNGAKNITANFAIDTYTLTITSPNGSVTKNPDLAQYDSNSTVQLMPVPNSGYHFVNWSGNASGSAIPLSVTMNGNKSITANFSIDTYTLTITSPNGSVTKNPDLAQYDSNTTVQLTPVPNSGYHFVNWSGDASGSAIPLSVVMNANKNITANFAIDTYTLTVTSPNGSVTKNPDLAQYDSNTTVQLTPVPNTGYHFVNWSGDATGSIHPLTVTMNANKNITANFAIDTYTLSITSPNGSVTKNPDLAQYDSNTTVQLTPIQNTGYHFVNWSGDASGSTIPLIVTMNANKNITANFAIDTYTLTITSPNGSVTKNPLLAEYDSNTTVQLTPVPNTGYHFVNWSGDATGVTNPLSVTMDGDKNITANFAINTFTLTSSAGLHGAISPLGIDTVDYNTSHLYTITPDIHYHVADVVVDGNSIGAVTGYSFDTVKANHTISASFAINTYIITATSGVNGSISPSGGVSVNEGSDQQFIFLPTIGYRVDSVLVDNVKVDSTESYTFTNVTAIHTISVAYIFVPVFRTFRPDSIVNDKDNYGHFSKYVHVSPDKVEFKLYVVSSIASVNGLHMEFILNIDTSFNLYTVPPSTKRSVDPRLKKWDFTFGSPLTPGDTVYIYGYGAKGSKQGVSQFWWTLNGSIDGKKLRRVVTLVYNHPRYPMPNRINVLNETFVQHGYDVIKNGLLLGVARLDSPKVYGWVIHRKYTEVMRSIAIRRGTQVMFQDGTPRGFDFFTSGRAFVGIQTTLLPTKQDNALVANLIGLKFSIIASALQITPVGLGQLILQDTTSNPFNGMTIRQIADKADTMMTGYPGRVFASPAAYAILNSTVARILAAFEGPMDTISFAKKLVVRGAQRLQDVPFLHANPAAIPEIITPYLENSLPAQYALQQNYPNPFNPTTTIEFTLPFTSTVTLKIYNLLGQEVATLINNEQMGDGIQSVDFNAANYASGVYLYRITARSANTNGTANTFSSVKKMVLIK